MNINRHNYEEFFLLYIDNELQPEERLAVEQFVAENPDLKPELDLLSQTSLLTEEHLFDNKDSLLRPEPVSDEEQASLILLLDDELDQEKSLELKRKLSHNSQLQAEWTILQQTKLDAADRMEFPDKQSLYRRTTGRVISIRLLRMAAAAAVVGLGLYSGLRFISNRESAQPDMAVSTSSKQMQSTPDEKTAGQNSTASTASVQPGQNGATVGNKQVNNIHTGSGEDKKENRALTGSQDYASADDKKAGNKKGTATPNMATTPERQQQQAFQAENNSIANRTEKKYQAPGNISSPTDVSFPEKRLTSNTAEPALIASTGNEMKEKGIKKLSALDTDIMQPLTVPDARVASLSNQDEETGSVLFLDEETVKKSKANGLFRKVKRTLERATKIKTGNGIRIAGFEIAAR